MKDMFEQPLFPPPGRTAREDTAAVMKFYKLPKAFPKEVLDEAARVKDLMRETEDAIEAEGVRRSEALIAKADVVIDFRTRDRNVACHENAKTVFIHAKCDLSFGEGLNISAKTGEGLDTLRALLPHRMTAFAGPSGVGKSSLLSQLLGRKDLSVGAVSEKIKRGRHTTRHSEIMRLDSDTYVVDTPGFSALDFEHLDPREVLRLFPDMLPYSGGCKFSSCLHLSEPECTVKQAVADGHIQAERYDTYCKILTSIAERKR